MLNQFVTALFCIGCITSVGAAQQNERDRIVLPSELRPLTLSDRLREAMAQQPNRRPPNAAAQQLMLQIIRAPNIEEERFEPADVAPQLFLLGALRARKPEVRLTLSVRFSVGKPRFVLAMASSDGHDPQPARIPMELPQYVVDYSDSIAKRQIDHIDLLCDLDESQRAKLTLAAKGDFSRLAREIRQWEEKYSGMAFDVRGVAEEFRAATEEVSAINLHLNAGPLRVNSLFCKVMRTALTADQLNAIASSQIRDWLRAVPLALDLDHRQMDELVSLLISRWDPSLGESLVWDSQVTLFLLQKVDPAQLAEFLGEQQLKSILRLVNNTLR